MPSLISVNQKISLQAVFTDIHDTFKRSLKAFKDGKKIVLSSNPNYSHVYEQRPLGNITYESVEKTIEARVYYLKSGQEKEAITPAAQGDLTIEQANAHVRLKVTPEDFEFLNTAERIVLDGHVFRISSTEVPHGLFGSGFYTIFLKRTP